MDAWLGFRWPRLPRRTLRFQLALLYGGFFLVLGMLVLAVPVFTIHSSTAAGSTPAMLAQSDASQRAQVLRALATLAGLVTVSFGVGWFIAGRFLRPLHTITATARDISVSNLHRRVSLGRRDDEFAELGSTLDDLFGRLEASFESQRRFVANASHELRTPLAAERAVLQVALADPDASAQTLRATCAEVLVLGEAQERLIDALLTLASSEGGLDRWEPFDLAELAAKVLTDRQGEAARRGLVMHASLRAAPATGDPDLVEALVANLVDNALRHNVGGGPVEVATTIIDGRAVVSVGNAGRLIPPGEVDRLFQPFQRLGADRVGGTGFAGGHGLGLAIVRAIAVAHGATVSARARSGGGLDVEVSFP
jgi:signal transduction histidine kinase